MKEIRDAMSNQELSQRALELYGGLLLPGFYEGWIVREQERLSEVYWQAGALFDFWTA